MKNVMRGLIPASLAFALSLAGSTAARAAGTETTFCGTGCGGPNNYQWNDNDNWTQDAPIGSSRAIIPAGFSVTISVSTAEADSLEIEAGATLTIEDGARLKLKDNASPDLGHSEIDGALDIEKGGELRIFHNAGQAIKGDGGTITGLTTGGTATPLIGRESSESCTKDLRIYSSVGAGSARADSLVIHGLLDIQVKLENDAYVVADNGDLTLSTCAKSGDDGSWVAEGNNTLIVDVAVSGGSEWQLLDDEDAVIQFNAACSSLSGKFDITLGTLDINADVTSTGILDFRSVNQSHPRIDVAFGDSASFGQ